MTPLLAAVVDSGLIGTAMPLLVALVVRTHWASWEKATVAVGASLAAGTLGAWAAGQLSGLPWGLSIVAALVASQAAYVKFWHSTGIAPWIEQATTPKPTP